VSKGTFFHHFPDRCPTSWRCIDRFHDVLFDEVTAVIGDMRPGKDRLAAAATTYLDGCLRDRGVKALLLEARGHLPIAEEVTRRNRMKRRRGDRGLRGARVAAPARSRAAVDRCDGGMRVDGARTWQP
jgi:AcrR family transcriptional regulator